MNRDGHVSRDERVEQAVVDVIEKWFKEGEVAATADADKIIDDDPIVDKQHTPCPYAAAPGRHWWTRGYMHQARLLRCLAAEGMLRSAADSARLIHAEVHHYLGKPNPR